MKKQTQNERNEKFLKNLVTAAKRSKSKYDALDIAIVDLLENTRPEMIRSRFERTLWEEAGGH